jgi:hypothetical protein
MARIKVRYFVEKPGPAGEPSRFYWQPSAALRELGWKPQRLADRQGHPITDRAAAIAAAEALNRELDAWRLGAGPAGTLPAPKVAAPVTVAELIQRYRLSPRFRELAPKTRYDYEWCLGIVTEWAGDAPARTIGRALAQKFYASMQQATPAKANAVMRVARLLFKFAWDHELVASNPFEKPGLVGTEPRLRIWTPAEVDIVVEVADLLERPSIGDAVLLALYVGQRQGDVLRLPWVRYQDKRIRLRQSKRGAWIDAPAVPRLVERLAAARARLDAHGCRAPEIVVSEETGRGYGSDNFRHHFAAVRDEAIAEWCRRDRPAAAAEGREAMTPAKCPLADVWYMDLRDTAVTNLAEAGCTVPEICAISGHSERSVYGILKHYLATSGEMASKAIAKLVAWEEARDRAPATKEGEQA